MATYKVIADIEAEDKLLGPLTLRQFIYAGVVIVLGFICFKLIPLSPFAVIPFIPPMIFFGLLAAPFGHDQSSEVWMLAKIRFFLKPRIRIWSQDGIKELVTITVPKKIEKHLTDGLNQYEVKSRLQALATTLDSRGWVIKNIGVNTYNPPSYLTAATNTSDRLIEVDNLPQEVPDYELFAADDMMDEQTNPTAQNLEYMINKSDQDHRQAVVQSMQSATPVVMPAGQVPAADYWFMNQPAPRPVMPMNNYTASPAPSTVVRPAVISSPAVSPIPPIPSAPSKSAEEELLERVHREKDFTSQAYGHMKTLQPLSEKSKVESQMPQAVSQKLASTIPDPQPTAPPTSTASAKPNPAIQRLASNDDLNVATLAREAEKASPKPLENEVVISLH